MNIIREQRETIIQDANTAQRRFTDILATLNKRHPELIVREPLSGDLDLSVLAENGFGAITKIVFAKGDITSIIHVPDGIEHLECSDNLLVSVDDLPGSLLTLKIEHNYLPSIDMSTLPNLTLLYISHNKISTIENLPKSIVDLRCENNVIERLDLNGLNKLRTLHISNNKITVIENLPTEIIDFQMENTPTIEFRNTERIPGNKTAAADMLQRRQTYKDALNEYFRIKNKYETDELSLKRKLYNRAPTQRMARQSINAIKMPCIKCKRKVGTVFKRVDSKYIALCGDTKNPCQLNIQIYQGESIHYEPWLYSFKESAETFHEAIIQQKLDTLFNYIGEEESLQLFKTEMNAYMIDSATYKELLDVHNNMYNNEVKIAATEKKNGELFRLIEQNREMLDEYEKSGNRELLKSAMELQVEQIIPESRNLRMLKYEIMEMDRREITSTKNEHVLFQYPSQLSNLDYITGEPPRVISFVK
jgi:hypothetical protein